MIKRTLCFSSPLQLSMRNAQLVISLREAPEEKRTIVTPIEMSDVRFNAYRIMWLVVMFDLPTTSKKERHDYTVFRKQLERDGMGSN